MFLSECQKFSFRQIFFAAAFCIFLLFAASCGTSKQTHLDRGEQYLQKRQFHAAVMEFRAAAEIDQTSAEAHWGLARAYENLGHLFETVEALRKTVELNPEKIEAKAKLGNYYLLVEPPLIGDTERLLEEIFALDPNFIEGHILKASLFAAQGKSQDEVLEVLRHAISLDPRRAESYLSLARYFMRIEQAEKAEEAIKTAIREGENKSLAHLEYARFLGYLEKNVEAENEYLQAIAAAPENLEAREAIAEFYAATRQLEKAEAAYKELIRIQENSPESRIALAEFYARVGRGDDAVGVLQEILADAPHVARARYRLAELYLERRQYDAVRAEVEQLLSVNDTDAEALMLRARLHLAENDPEAAVKDLEEILKKQPSQREALFYMAQARLASGQTDQARAFIGDLERFHPNFLRTRLLKIQLSFMSGNAEQALLLSNQLLEAVKTTYPTVDVTALELEDLRQRALTSRGLARLELGRLAEARADLEEIVRRSPKSAAALVNLAKVSTAENKTDEALDLYAKAAALDRENFDALSGSVGILTRRGDFQGARDLIDRAIEQNAGKRQVLAALYYLSADIFTAQKNQPAAEAELKKSIEADENFLPAYSAYAAMLAGKNQTAEAIAQYRSIVEKKPSSSIYVLIGMLEEGRGNFAEAEASYRKALEIAPDSPIAANNLAWLISEHTNGNLDEALRLAQTAVNQNQRAAAFYDTLGWVYFKKGLFSPAVEQLKKAVALDEAEARRTGAAVNEDFRRRLAIAVAQSNGGPKA